MQLGKIALHSQSELEDNSVFTVLRLRSVSEHDTTISKMQPILLFLDQIAANSMATTTASSVTTFNQDSNTSSTDAPTTGTTMEIVIRRVGMEDHINIVKLFQVGNLFVSNFVEVYISNRYLLQGL